MHNSRVVNILRRSAGTGNVHPAGLTGMTVIVEDTENASLKTMTLSPLPSFQLLHPAYGRWVHPVTGATNHFVLVGEAVT